MTIGMNMVDKPMFLCNLKLILAVASVFSSIKWKL